MRKIKQMLVFVLVVGLVLTSVHIISAQMQDRRQRGTGQQQRRQMDPAQMMERILERTMEPLNLSEEEGAVLQPMIKGLLQKRMDQGIKRREAVNALREAINAKDAEKVKVKLTEIKAMRKKHREESDKLEKELTELLTLVQEAQLTVSGAINADGSGMQFGGGRPQGTQRGNRPGGGGAGGGVRSGRQRPQ